jgi:hypothetical protein
MFDRALKSYDAQLHPLQRGQREVVIYDYVDADEPLLAKMASMQEAGYRALGYDVMQAGDLFFRGTVPPVRKTGGFPWLFVVGAHPETGLLWGPV